MKGVLAQQSVEYVRTIIIEYGYYDVYNCATIAKMNLFYKDILKYQLVCNRYAILIPELGRL